MYFTLMYTSNSTGMHGEHMMDDQQNRIQFLAHDGCIFIHLWIDCNFFSIGTSLQ